MSATVVDHHDPTSIVELTETGKEYHVFLTKISCHPDGVSLALLPSRLSSLIDDESFKRHGRVSAEHELRDDGSLYASCHQKCERLCCQALLIQLNERRGLVA